MTDTLFPEENGQPLRYRTFMDFGIKYGMTSRKALLASMSFPELVPQNVPKNKPVITQTNKENKKDIRTLKQTEIMVLLMMSQMLSQQEFIHAECHFCSLMQLTSLMKMDQDQLHLFINQLRDKALITERTSQGYHETVHTDQLGGTHRRRSVVRHHYSITTKGEAYIRSITLKQLPTATIETTTKFLDPHTQKEI